MDYRMINRACKGEYAKGLCSGFIMGILLGLSLVWFFVVQLTPLDLPQDEPGQFDRVLHN